MPGKHAPVLLLDGASMWFRSFFGVPSSITAPDGRELTDRWEEAQDMRDIVRGVWREVNGAP